MFKPITEQQESIVETLEVELNGRMVKAQGGVSVASVVLGKGEKFTRTTPVSGSKRGPFCMMGVCYDCLMIIDGKSNQRACSIEVQPGMKIATQYGVGAVAGNNT
jgi:predicted molibdopterin-dependent oxidoreductase YjgC